MQLHLLFNIFTREEKLSGITRCPELPGLPLDVATITDAFGYDSIKFLSTEKKIKNNLRKLKMRVKLVLRTEFQNLVFSFASERKFNTNQIILNKFFDLFCTNCGSPHHSLINWCPFLWRPSSIDWNCCNLEVLCSFPFFPTYTIKIPNMKRYTMYRNEMRVVFKILIV